MKPVWIVDDDRSIRWVLEKTLSRESIPFKSFASADRGAGGNSIAAPSRRRCWCPTSACRASRGLDLLQAGQDALPDAAGHHHDRLFRSG